MKLGPRWTEDECHTFFESFKEHGRNWTKVAAGIPNRTAAMCEALFNLNRSFLSLPIDAISGVALSALVTDHYNNLPLDERDGDSVSDYDTTKVGVDVGGGDESAAAPLDNARAGAAVAEAERSREETPEREGGKGDTAANGSIKGTPSRPSKSGLGDDPGGTPGGRVGVKARASPARKTPPVGGKGGGGGGANGITSSKDGRVVGRRTPRSNPNVNREHKGERAAATAAGLAGNVSDIDVLEMAGHALVSMSPGPTPVKGQRTPTHSRVTPGGGAKGSAGRVGNKGKGGGGFSSRMREGGKGPYMPSHSSPLGPLLRPLQGRRVRNDPAVAVAVAADRSAGALFSIPHARGSPTVPLLRDWRTRHWVPWMVCSCLQMPPHSRSPRRRGRGNPRLKNPLVFRPPREAPREVGAGGARAGARPHRGIR